MVVVATISLFQIHSFPKNCQSKCLFIFDLHLFFSWLLFWKKDICLAFHGRNDASDDASIVVAGVFCVLVSLFFFSSLFGKPLHLPIHCSIFQWWHHAICVLILVGCVLKKNYLLLGSPPVVPSFVGTGLQFGGSPLKNSCTGNKTKNRDSILTPETTLLGEEKK